MLVAFPLLFKGGGNEIVQFQIAGRAFLVTDAGLRSFSTLLLKTWFSIQASVLLGAVTRFENLLVGLRALGYPRLLSAVLALMWRYAFVLASEAQRMLTARAARSGISIDGTSRPGGPLLWRAKVTGGMAGNLLLRSLERGERIYQAMKSRGYDGEVRGGMEEKRLLPGEKLMIAGMALCALLVLVIANQIY